MQGYDETLKDVFSEKNQKSLSSTIEAVADMKFTYIVTCQNYGLHKRSQDPRALDILNLMKEWVLYFLFLMCGFWLFNISINWSWLVFYLHSSPSHCRHPSLRVAYIDVVEDEEKKEYYSKLVKVVVSKDDDRNVTEQVHVNMPWFFFINVTYSLITFGFYKQEIYNIKLPGNPKLGEGKPENQNHAIIFTRGEALQAIDMNQV